VPPQLNGPPLHGPGGGGTVSLNAGTHSSKAFFGANVFAPKSSVLVRTVADELARRLCPVANVVIDVVRSRDVVVVLVGGIAHRLNLREIEGARSRVELILHHHRRRRDLRGLRLVAKVAIGIDRRRRWIGR
jgi:hypothetical protein